MMKWDLEKPNSCLKATELINGGSKAIPFSCSHFLISDLLWDTVNVPHWKIYNPSHRNPLLYIHDSEPRHTEVHIILVAIAECCPPGCWSICVPHFLWAVPSQWLSRTGIRQAYLLEIESFFKRWHLDQGLILFLSNFLGPALPSKTLPFNLPSSSLSFTRNRLGCGQTALLTSLRSLASSLHKHFFS